MQGLTVVALERRGTIAVLRAGGAGAPTVVRLLLGVVLVAAVPAALLGLVVESVALAPLVGNLAAGYADLVPRATVAESLVVAAGLACCACSRRSSSRGARCAGRSSRGCAADETRALALLLGAVVVALLGCGGDAPAPPGQGGSTASATWRDTTGRRARALPRRVARGPQGPRPGRARRRRGRARRFGVVTDAHVRDEESPARATFLDRLGRHLHADVPPAGGAHHAGARRRAPRPAIAAPAADRRGRGPHRQRAVQRARPGARGDARRAVDPDSGAPGYTGVQEADDPDPFFYRPDVDPPLHPGLLAAAQRPFTSPGRGRPVAAGARQPRLARRGRHAPDAGAGRRRDRRLRAARRRRPGGAARGRARHDGRRRDRPRHLGRAAGDPHRRPPRPLAGGCCRARRSSRGCATPRASRAPGTGCSTSATSARRCGCSSSTREGGRRGRHRVAGAEQLRERATGG